jgi:hypothetical protein
MRRICDPLRHVFRLSLLGGSNGMILEWITRRLSVVRRQRSVIRYFMLADTHQMAAHERTKTIKLYDGTSDTTTLGEVTKIAI